jgi:hypothetical protein
MLTSRPALAAYGEERPTASYLGHDRTGRFAKVTGGSFIMVATSAPFFLRPTQNNTTPFAYSWQGSGSLTFARGN